MTTETETVTLWRPTGPEELTLVEASRGYRVQHDEHQIVLGQPVPHAHRHQQRLITLREKEILRHTS